MKNLIRHILLEEAQKWEYQVRDIGGPVYYKRKKGSDWFFIDEVEFYKDSNRNNTVKWVEKKPKKGPKIKQLEVPQKKVDKLDYLYIYYQNLTSNDCKVEKTDDSIIIKVK
jgi:hypothetical protein